MSDRGILPVRIACPGGPLVRTVEQHDFAFDIAEIDGIWASRSSKKYFPSIDAFGKDFVNFKRAPVDKSGLDRMLAHREIRLIHSPGQDSVELNMWDGRLFLQNGGGSHHLAAAAYIARTCELKVPLQAKLRITVVNELAVAWLRSQFFPIAIRWPAYGRGHCRLPILMATLVDRCFEMEVSPALHEGCRLMLVSRDHQAAPDIVDILARYGGVDVTNWFSTLIATQETIVAACQRRFGDRIRTSIPPVSHQETTNNE